MTYMDELKFFWNLVWNPEKYTKRQLNFGSALKLYYTVALLPFIAYIVVGSIMILTGASTHSAVRLFPGFRAFLGAASYASVILGGIFLFFIILPLSIAIDAFLYQVIAKFFLNVWRGNYEKTFAALVFALFPLLLLMWLDTVPFLNVIFIILAPIWTIVVLVLALSQQQKITRLNALLTMIIKSIIVLLVLVLLGLSVATTVGYILSSLMPAGGIVGPMSNLTSSWFPTGMMNP